MYNISVHAQQVLGATVAYVSWTETSDEGITYPIATSVSSSNLHSQADEDPAWIFLEQIRDALSRVFQSSGEGLWFQVTESGGIDGGWGGAGQTRRPERSEDDSA